MTYDVSTAKFALRILRNPKIELHFPLTIEQMFEQHVDFVILRKDDRALYQHEIKQCQGFWYPWVSFSKKHPIGYMEKHWQKEIESQDKERVTVGWSTNMKALPLAHVYFDSQEDLEKWFGEERWAELVMKLIV